MEGAEELCAPPVVALSHLCRRDKYNFYSVIFSIPTDADQEDEDSDMFPAWLYDRQQQQAGAAQSNPAEPPRILHMNVTVLRECSKYPTLEMDESCKLFENKYKYWT